MTLLEFYKVLQKPGIPVWHYEAQQEKTPYIVYGELATTYSYASGQPTAEKIKVEVVHFTDKEFCPSLECLKRELHKNKIAFTIAHGYDPEAKQTVNQFDITIIGEMEENDEH